MTWVLVASNAAMFAALLLSMRTARRWERLARQAGRLSDMWMVIASEYARRSMDQSSWQKAYDRVVNPPPPDDCIN